MDSLIEKNGIVYWNILVSAPDEPSTHRILGNLKEYYESEIQLFMSGDSEAWLIMLDDEELRDGETIEQLTDFYTYVLAEKENLHV